VSVAQEAKVVLRSLRHRPGMVAAILLTLALGIGVNTAVFTLIHAVLLQPLKVRAPEQLVAIYFTRGTEQYGSTSLAAYDALSAQSRTLSSVAGSATVTANTPTDDGVEEVSGVAVTTNYFITLGIQAALGRTILPRDSVEDPAIVVISASFWRRHFGADMQVVGKRVTLRGTPMTVVGVMPEGFHGTNLTTASDVWMPLSALPLLDLPLMATNGQPNRLMPFFALFGRVASEDMRGRVAAEVERLTAHADVTPDLGAPAHGVAAARRVTVVPIVQAAGAIRDRGTLLRFFRVIVVVALLTLLLVCMNIGNLLVIRARERSHELGVRLALGASSWGVARQLLIESLVLALLGGVIGVSVALAALRVISVFTLPGHIALGVLALRPDRVMLGFAVAASVATALIFGAFPAISAARADVLDVLNDRVAAAGAGRRRQALIAFQVAASLVALVSASLLLRSISAALGTGVGFPADRIAAVTMTRDQDGRYLDNLARYEAVVAQLGRTIGVEAGAISTHVPLAEHSVRPIGRGQAPDVANPAERTVAMGFNYISKDYFKVMDLPITAGRAFAETDRSKDDRVMILNESAARALWPGEPAIGKTVHAPYFGKMEYSYRVVGVARDSKYAGLQDEHVPYAYVHLPQVEPPGAPLTILTRGNHPRALLATMQRTAKDVAPALRVAPNGSLVIPGPSARVLADQVKILVAPQRFGATLLTGFAALALLVSAVGIYGNVAYVMSRRTTEIGIRMALGAPARAVLELVLTDAGTAVGMGLVAGMIGAGMASHALEKLLFGVQPIDPWSFAIGMVVTIVCAVGAAFVPSLRSVRIDPARAMRTLG
jgi:predicted permease